MAELTNLEIITGDPSGPYSRLTAGHYFRSAQGFLTVTQFYNTEVYEMDDCVINVPYRRRGYAKELLKLASAHARLLGARAISASNIVNRASIDALSSVFGEESLSINTLGDYAPEGYDENKEAPTKASMFHEIPDTDIANDDYTSIVMKSLQSINPMVRSLNDQLLVVARGIYDIEQKMREHPSMLNEEDALTYDALQELGDKLMKEREQIRAIEPSV